MPKIEIVSLRFNLDKEEDNRLFALLQIRADAGKRNEFLKQLLSDALTGGVTGERVKPPQSRMPHQQPVEPLADRAAPETQGSLETATSPESGQGPAADVGNGGPDRGGASSTAEPDREAAILVGSFVQ